MKKVVLIIFGFLQNSAWNESVEPLDGIEFSRWERAAVIPVGNHS